MAKLLKKPYSRVLGEDWQLGGSGTGQRAPFPISRPAKYFLKRRNLPRNHESFRRIASYGRDMNYVSREPVPLRNQGAQRIREHGQGSVIGGGSTGAPGPGVSADQETPWRWFVRSAAGRSTRTCCAQRAARACCFKRTWGP